MLRCLKLLLKSFPITYGIYLAPVIVRLALFDSQVSAQTKRLMVRAMKDGNEDHEQGATEYFPVNLCATAGASGLGVWGTRTTDYC